MEIMALLKSFIYLTASSLLVPVLLLLAILTVWLVVYSGSFCGLWLARARLPRRIDVILCLERRDVTNLPAPVRHFYHSLTALNRPLENGSEDETGKKDRRQAEIAVLNLLRETEHRRWRSLDRLKMLIRIGPGLGLIGTLIPMGTGLASLSQGDLTRLSGDLVIAFTTAVVGMALGLLSYFFFTVQRRWVEEDVRNMELICELEMGKHE